MFEKLKELKKNSYSPKSEYATACIIRMKDGNTFEGVNVENPSFKDGLCAEQVAIGSAVAAGYTKGEFECLYLLGSSSHAITPCFLCRQYLIELFNMNSIIISYNETGEETVFKLEDLCPYAFSEEDLHD